MASAGSKLDKALNGEETDVVENTQPVDEETTDVGLSHDDKTTPVQDTPEQPAEHEPNPFVTRLRDEFGFADVEDEQTAQERLLEAFATQRRESEQLRRYYEEELFRARVQSAQQTPQQQTDSPSKASPFPVYPEVDRNLVSRYQVMKEDGTVGWAEGTPAAVRQQAEEYEQAVRKWSDMLVYNPEQAFRGPVEHIVQQVLQEKLGMSLDELPERLDLRGDRAADEHILRTHGEELYQKDPVTNTLTQALSPLGERVNQLMQQWSGIENKWERFQAAHARASMELGSQQRQMPTPAQQAVQPPVQPAAQPPTRQQARQQRRRENLRQSIPDRSGSFPTNPNDAAQNRHLSAGQQLAINLFGED